MDWTINKFAPFHWNDATTLDHLVYFLSNPISTAFSIHCSSKDFEYVSMDLGQYFQCLYYTICMCQQRDSSPKTDSNNQVPGNQHLNDWIEEGVFEFGFCQMFSPDFWFMMRFPNCAIFWLMLRGFLPFFMEETPTSWHILFQKLLECHEPCNVQELNILFDRKNGLAPGKYYQAEILRLDDVWWVVSSNSARNVNK